jgi:hypothetical protein
MRGRTVEQSALEMAKELAVVQRKGGRLSWGEVR